MQASPWGQTTPHSGVRELAQLTLEFEAEVPWGSRAQPPPILPPRPCLLPSPSVPFSILSAPSFPQGQALLLLPCTGDFLPGRAQQVQTNRSLFFKARPCCYLQRISTCASQSPRFTGFLPSHMEVSELLFPRLICYHRHTCH